MYLISFYVPETHLEKVKKALFDRGAGKFQKYDSCSWQIKGQGQFRPLKGSKPFVGETGEIHKLNEYKVEMICKKEILSDALKALVEAHPYEEPAYHAIRINTLDNGQHIDE